MTSLLSITFGNLHFGNRPDPLESHKLQLKSILKRWVEAPENKLGFSEQKKIYSDTEALLNKLTSLTQAEQFSIHREAFKLCTDYSSEAWEESAKWIAYHNEAYPSFQRLIKFCSSAEDKLSDNVIPEDINYAVLRHMQNNPFQFSKLPEEILNQIFFVHKNAEVLLKEMAKAKRISKSINVHPIRIKKLVINPTKIGSRLQKLGATPLCETLKFTTSRGIDTKWLQSLPAVKSVSVNDIRDLKFLEPLKDSLQKLKLSKIYQDNLDQLSRFTNLKTLKLRDAFLLENVDFLNKISKQLEILELSKAQNVKNFDCIAQFSDLTTLNLSKNELSNLDFLKKLTKLKHLDLSECRYVTNLEALNHCSSTIETLNLTLCCGIENFESLNNLSSLKTINITGCQISQAAINSLKNKGILVIGACAD